MATGFEELASKRQALIARRRDLKSEMTKLAKDISAIDHVMTLLDPGHVREAPASNPTRYSGKMPFAPGEMTALALVTLRRADGPISATDCARAMIAEKNIPPELQTRLADRVSTILAKKAATGQVRRVTDSDGHHVKWGVAR